MFPIYVLQTTTALVDLENKTKQYAASSTLNFGPHGWPDVINYDDPTVATHWNEFDISESFFQKFFIACHSKSIIFEK